jgi:hypothetical protein
MLRHNMGIAANWAKEDAQGLISNLVFFQQLIKPRPIHELDSHLSRKLLSLGAEVGRRDEYALYSPISSHSTVEVADCGRANDIVFSVPLALKNIAAAAERLV